MLHLAYILPLVVAIFIAAQRAGPPPDGYA